jgi:small multidrug resistance pump
MSVTLMGRLSPVGRVQARGAPATNFDTPAPQPCRAREGGSTVHWVFLMAAIALEVAGTTCMKLSEGFSKLVPSVLVFVFYGSCLGMLTMAFEKLPVSVAYTVWGSVGTVLVVMVGMTVFNERLTVPQLLSIALIIVGVMGLNMTRAHDEAGAAAEIREETPASQVQVHGQSETLGL